MKVFAIEESAFSGWYLGIVGITTKSGFPVSSIISLFALLNIKLGSVDIDSSNLVRINSNFIAARGMMLSYSKFMSCNNKKIAVKRTRWAALSVLFVTLSSIYVA